MNGAILLYRKRSAALAGIIAAGFGARVVVWNRDIVVGSCSSAVLNGRTAVLGIRGTLCGRPAGAGKAEEGDEGEVGWPHCRSGLDGADRAIGGPSRPSTALAECRCDFPQFLVPPSHTPPSKRACARDRTGSRLFRWIEHNVGRGRQQRYVSAGRLSPLWPSPRRADRRRLASAPRSWRSAADAR